MRFNFTLILFIVLLISCNTEGNIEYYKDGTKKTEYSLLDEKFHGDFYEYYETGKIKEKHVYEKGVKIDSSIYYSLNSDLVNSIVYHNDTLMKVIIFDNKGEILSKGNTTINNLKIGDWEWYEENKLRTIEKFKIIEGESYLNESIELNNQGDTINQGSFFTIDINRDTLNINESLKAVAILEVPLFKKNKSEIIVVLPKYNSKNFNQDFSNQNEVVLDTFFSLNQDISNQKWFEGYYRNHTAVFGNEFTKSGKKLLRGYILEYYNRETGDNSNTLDREEHKKYFEIPIYVEDSLDNGSN